MRFSRFSPCRSHRGLCIHHERVALPFKVLAIRGLKGLDLSSFLPSLIVPNREMSIWDTPRSQPDGEG